MWPSGREGGRAPRRGSAIERPQLVRDEAERRDSHDRDRLRWKLADAEHLHEDRQQPETDDEGDDADDQEARSLVAPSTVVGAERPAAMPDEVVGDRDEEGDRRRGAI